MRQDLWVRPASKALQVRLGCKVRRVRWVQMGLRVLRASKAIRGLKVPPEIRVPQVQPARSDLPVRWGRQGWVPRALRDCRVQPERLEPQVPRATRA